MLNILILDSNYIYYLLGTYLCNYPCYSLIKVSNNHADRYRDGDEGECCQDAGVGDGEGVVVTLVDPYLGVQPQVEWHPPEGEHGGKGGHHDAAWDAWLG